MEPKTSRKTPYLSFVVTSRNDNHGGDLLRRMQIFTNALIEQTKRFHLPSELIFVEWNPPQDKPRLAEALQWPEDPGPCSVRIIEVPPRLHRTFKHSDKLPLFQMIAKNVGIRRAKAPFVCATNIDVIFDDELMKFLAEQTLDPDAMYRLDRYDIPADVPQEHPIEEQLEFCRTSTIRINVREGTFKPEQPVKRWFFRTRDNISTVLNSSMPAVFRIIGTIYQFSLKLLHAKEWKMPVWIRVWFPYKFKPYYLFHVPILYSFVVNRIKLLKYAIRNLFVPAENRVNLFPPENMRWEEYWEYLEKNKGGSKPQTSDSEKSFPGIQLVHRLENVDFNALDVRTMSEKYRIPRKTLHTNACGDFTLLSKKQWLRLRGYPEWEMYSFNIDSYFCYNAYYGGVKEVFLPEPYRFYHIEHAAGWTPEASESLKNRMIEKGIPWFDWLDCLKLIDRMYERQKPLMFNDRNWGLGDKNLKEIIIDKETSKIRPEAKRTSHSLHKAEVIGDSR